MTRASLFAALGLSAVLAAACGQPAPPATPPVAQNPGPPLTPNPMPPGYVGRWAASADLCEAGAWVFTDKGLTTAGEVSCTFTAVTPNESGWIAEGACIAQAPAAPASLVLNTTRAGAERTLAVSGGPFKGPQVLTACDVPGGPPAPGAAAAPGPTGLADAAAIDSRIAAAGDGIKAGEFKQDGLIAKAWREGDAIVRITEPLMGGVGRKIGERSFYYRPGDLDPFLVRDAEAAYALEGGKLTAVYSREGTELQARAARDKAEIEGRVLSRARELRTAAG